MPAPLMNHHSPQELIPGPQIYDTGYDAGRSLPPCLDAEQEQTMQLPCSLRDEIYKAGALYWPQVEVSEIRGTLLGVLVLRASYYLEDILGSPPFFVNRRNCKLANPLRPHPRGHCITCQMDSYTRQCIPAPGLSRPVWGGGGSRCSGFGVPGTLQRPLAEYPTTLHYSTCHRATAKASAICLLVGKRGERSHIVC